VDAFLGTIMPVAFNYPPRGWAFCNGQLMSISQNSALFALLGTMYGGDGVTTFALPDLRGRVIAGSQGNGPGLQAISQGQIGGTNTVTVTASGSAVVNLTAANLPAHTHAATATAGTLAATTTVEASTATTGAVTTPAAGYSLGTSPAGGPTSAAIYSPPAAVSGPVALGGVATTLSGGPAVTVEANTGGGQPLAAPVQTQAQASVMQPFTGINYVICVEGIFPPRD
jgi:microcystin-dependent protein